MSHAASRYVKHLIQAPNGDVLSIAEKLVLSQLADDHNEDERCAWPAVPYLASRACMTERYCRQLLRRLEASGVLESTPRLRENGGRSSSGYRFPEIDPPFDAKKVKQTEKVMRMQASKRAERAVQMKLETQNSEIFHSTPPELQFRGGRNSSSGGGGTPVPGGAELQFRGTGNSSSGGKELPLKLPAELRLDSPIEPNKEPPTPDSGGENPQLDLDSFSLLKVRLKSDLSSIPASVARRFREVKPGENDYDTCFREWWLLDVRRDEAERVVIVTAADDVHATDEGLVKYKSRLNKLARSVFANTRGRQFAFEVQRGEVPEYLST